MDDYYYDPEFYEEPSEFEQEMHELKASIAQAVKKEFQDKMELLERENASLREWRDHKAQHERELAQVKREYESKKLRAEADAKRARLQDILKDQFSATGYRASATFTKGPKCDRCDENRKYHYVSPMGRKMTEDCTCGLSTVRYFPKEVPLVRFYIRKDRIGNAYYERAETDREYDVYSMCAEMYEKTPEMPFSEINSYRAVFLSEENCQKYCEWLNERAKEEEADRLTPDGKFKPKEIKMPGGADNA